MEEGLGGAISLVAVQATVIQVRGKAVILDEDLAKLFDVETRVLNQQVKRNIERFADQFVFQLTEAEAAALRSQDVMAKAGRGGRRSPPWAFTEHGVPMAASVLRSPRAVEAMRMIVDVFVTTRRQLASSDGGSSLTQAASRRLDSIRDGILKLGTLVAEFEVNKRDGTTVREEVDHLKVSVLDNVKAQLETKVVENRQIIADIQKSLAEAEKVRAEARKTSAEADSIDLKNMRERLAILQDIEARIEQTDVRPMLVAMDRLRDGPVSIEVTGHADLSG